LGLAARLGLRSTDAASASLILNLEGVFTALLAWFAFGENFDRRVASGMTLIVGGGVSLSVQSASVPGGTLGVLAIVLGAPLTALLVLAGLWLHLTEQYAHPHRDAAALH